GQQYLGDQIEHRERLIIDPVLKQKANRRHDHDSQNRRRILPPRRSEKRPDAIVKGEPHHEVIKQCSCYCLWTKIVRCLLNDVEALPGGTGILPARIIETADEPL